MNYIEQINRLNRFTDRVTRLSTGAYALWFRLMDIANASFWPDWVRVGTRTLMELMSIDSEKTFHKIRKELVDNGLIIFKRGNRGKLPSYHINQLDENLQIIGVKNTSNQVSNNGLDVNFTYSTGGNRGSNQGGIQPENKVPSLDNNIYINKNINKNNIRDIPNGISMSSNEDVKQSKDLDIKGIIDYWNSNCGAMPKITCVRGKRLTAVKARIREFSEHDVRVAIQKAGKSDFLNGMNDRGWMASFDWMIKPNNFVKVLEGNYDNRAEKKPPATKAKNLRIPPIDDDRLKAYQELEDSLFMNFKPRRDL